jgi:glucose-6-phosphate isomerase
MLEVKFSKTIKPNKKTLIQLEKIKNEMIRPQFTVINPDIKSIKMNCKKYQKYKNIIIIANGGSRNSTLGFVNSLFEFKNNKNIEFLNTPEPDEIFRLKKKYLSSNTLVIPTSKSGTNIDVLYPLSIFIKYPMLIITNDQDGALLKIARKQNIDLITHPNIGGRFAGRTVVSFVPLHLLNINIEKINKGCVDMYSRCKKEIPYQNNPALKIAVFLYEMESKNYTEIYSMIYSIKLHSFLPLITQLIHETTGKKNKGQTIYGDLGPECQHHSNQRFFGGRKNVVGCFMYVKNQDHRMKFKIQKNLKEIFLKNFKLKKLDNISLNNALTFDRKANMEVAEKNNIPYINISVNKVTPYTMGEFLAFWKYVVIYSALLRNQNPYDQPNVTLSKKLALKKAISFNK